MRKIITLYSGLFTLIFTLISFADTGALPQYQTTFTIPTTKGVGPGQLVIRFYQPWGNGERTGWQTLVTPPTVSIEGTNISGTLTFGYPSSNYTEGALGFGYDQYAQYYSYTMPKDSAGKVVNIIGTFPQVAYISATIYHNSPRGYIQEGVIDKDMQIIDNQGNPFIAGNPSVFAYSTELAAQKKSLTPSSIQKIAIKELPKTNVTSTTGQIDVYRLDKVTSSMAVADDIAPDGCSRAYLYAKKQATDEVIILRIKVPTTFIENNHPDTLFGDYQTRYISVSAQRNTYSDADPLLSFWTVNGWMLKDYIDEEGYAYVFFAPNDYAAQLAKEQNTPANQAPVMTWGRYKGYLLGNPDYAIAIRYRVPNINWQGSPEHVACYSNPAAIQPATKNELGIFLPEIFGGSMSDFQNGKIGAVSNQGPWPTSAK